jgi:hypothetical protein
VTEAPGNPAPDDRATVRDVQYKGEALDAARGPGLGCFWSQLAALALLVILTPLSVAWGWPPIVSTALLFAVLVLLLFAGQTVIFLLRLVAADRRAAARGRRRPLASGTKTVGELEDEARGDGDDEGRSRAIEGGAGDNPPGVRE